MSEAWRAKTRAAAHLVEDPMGKEVDLVRHGVHLDVLREEADERAAVQLVDGPFLFRKLGSNKTLKPASTTARKWVR